MEGRRIPSASSEAAATVTPMGTTARAAAHEPLEGWGSWRSTVHT